jgi:hypothetical protein
VSGLRERIEAKARRTATLPLQVGDVAAAAAEVATFRAALQAHLAVLQERAEAGGGEPAAEDLERTGQLRADLAEANRRQADTVAQVQLQALPSDQWEALASSARRDEDGDIDLEDVLGELLAASVVDQDLADADWWTGQLARPEYSRGDRLAIVNILVALNLHTPDGSQGKG